MRGVIRKIKFLFPFAENGGQQKALVFSVDDVREKFDGNKIYSIGETFNPVTGAVTYQIHVNNEKGASLWKELTPDGCTVEIEYQL